MVVGFFPSGTRQGQEVEFTNNKSGAPSLSKSKKATPPPIVSGNNLSPYAPLLCTNVMPASLVMSLNRARGISLTGSRRAAGASPSAIWVRGADDLRSSTKEIPATTEPTNNKTRRDRRNARPIMASSPGGSSSSVRPGGSSLMVRKLDPERAELTRVVRLWIELDNAECRMTNEIRSANDESLSGTHRFGFRHLSFFRHSSFGIGSCPVQTDFRAVPLWPLRQNGAVTQGALIGNRPLRWALVFLFWTLIGLSFASQFYLSSYKAGRPISWGQAVSWSLGDWYVWAAVSLPIVQLARRFRFDDVKWLRNVGIHLVASAVFSLGYMTLRA